MSRRAPGIATALVVAMALASGSASAHRAAGDLAGRGLVATRVLVARLAASGRGEATLTLTRSDPMGGTPETERGRVALEPPARMRLDLSGSGERIAVRAGGGEWVQPHARQMVRLRKEQTATMAGLWEVFLRGGERSFKERRADGRRYVLEPLDPESGLPGQVTIVLDTRGLPQALEMEDASGGVSHYRFRGWRFSRALGNAAFTLKAPAGFAIVDLP